MNYEFESREVLFVLLGITLLIIGIVFIIKYVLSTKDNLKEKYESNNKSLPFTNRSKYPEVDVFRLRKSILLFGFVTSILAVLVVFNWTTTIEAMDYSRYKIEVDDFFDIEIPRTVEEKKVLPKKIIQEIIEVPLDDILDENEQPDFLSMDPLEEYIETPTEDLIISKPLPKPEVKEDDSDLVLTFVEQMPRFPGCEDKATNAEREQCATQKLYEYIYNNLSYPNIARENGIEGKVTLRFAIDKKGKVSKVKILRDIGGGCGAVAANVIKGMNNLSQKWIPGRQGGRPVNVWYTLPLVFTLSK